MQIELTNKHQLKSLLIILINKKKVKSEVFR